MSHHPAPEGTDDPVRTTAPGAPSATQRRSPMTDVLGDETGATTAEYAITTLAACGFAAVMVVLLKSGEVRSLLMGIITSALSLGS